MMNIERQLCRGPTTSQSVSQAVPVVSAACSEEWGVSHCRPEHWGESCTTSCKQRHNISTTSTHTTSHHSTMGSVLYQSVRLVLGTLYPAYSSFKAVKTKNVKVSWVWQQEKSEQALHLFICMFSMQDYVNWMTYWIVFAIVTITEEISDLLLSFWLPFYYEIKIIFLFWLLSPVTRWNMIFGLFSFYHHLLVLQGLHADLQAGDPPRSAQQGGGHRPAAPAVERPELQAGSQVSQRETRNFYCRE